MVLMLDAHKDIEEIRALLKNLTVPVRSGPALQTITTEGEGEGGRRVLHIF
jgi:hypothetical protein